MNDSNPQLCACCWDDLPALVQDAVIRALYLDADRERVCVARGVNKWFRDRLGDVRLDRRHRSDWMAACKTHKLWDREAALLDTLRFLEERNEGMFKRHCQLDVIKTRDLSLNMIESACEDALLWLKRKGVRGIDDAYMFVFFFGYADPDDDDLSKADSLIHAGFCDVNFRKQFIPSGCHDYVDTYARMISVRSFAFLFQKFDNTDGTLLYAFDVLKRCCSCVDCRECRDYKITYIDFLLWVYGECVKRGLKHRFFFSSRS